MQTNFTNLFKVFQENKNYLKIRAPYDVFRLFEERNFGLKFFKNIKNVLNI